MSIWNIKTIRLEQRVTTAATTGQNDLRMVVVGGPRNEVQFNGTLGNRDEALWLLQLLQAAGIATNLKAALIDNQARDADGNPIPDPDTLDQGTLIFEIAVKAESPIEE